MTHSFETINQSAFDVWRLVNHIPGWVWKIQKAAKLTDDQVRSIEKIDDEWAGYFAEVRKGVQTFANEYPFGLWEAETDEDRISILSKLINEAYADYEALSRDGVDYATRKSILAVRDVEGMERLRRKIRARQVHKTEPDATRLTEWDISRAREFPIEKLLYEDGVEIRRDSKIICPFHPDRSPSMWIKNGWGYCHSCGASCDSIKWLMKVRGMRFHEAVRRLA